MKYKLDGIATAVRSIYVGKKNGAYLNQCDLDISENCGMIGYKLLNLPLGLSPDAMAIKHGRGSKFRVTIETIE